MWATAATGSVASSTRRMGADGKRRKMPRKAPANPSPSSASGRSGRLGRPRQWPPNGPRYDWSAVDQCASELGLSEADFKAAALPLQMLANGFLTLARDSDPRVAKVVPLVFDAFKGAMEKLSQEKPDPPDGLSLAGSQSTPDLRPGLNAPCQ